MTAKTFAELMALDKSATLDTIRAMAKGEKPDRVAVKFTKADEEQRVIYGWASVIEKDGVAYVDSDDDIISEKTLLDAARQFIRDRTGLAQHSGKQVAEIVESMVFTKDVQAALGIDLKMVGWLIAWHVTDDKTWQAWKDGEFKGFSIGYYARRVAVD